MNLFNNTAKIIKNKNLLSIEYQPNIIIGRKDEIKQLSDEFSYFFRDHPSLPSLFIYGNIGTGKTTICKYIFTELEKKVKEENIKHLKIVRIKCSESRSKYEILKQILTQVSPNEEITGHTSDTYNKLIKILAEKGYYILIFLDEIHELRDQELNNTLYTISRIGEDVSYLTNELKEKVLDKENVKQSHIGYIIISNDANIRNKLKESTKSSLTREGIIFKRYNKYEIISIMEARIGEALFEDILEEGVLDLISSISIREGQDARYAFLLLLNVCKEAEKRNLKKVTTELVEEVNQSLAQDYMKSILRDLPNLSKEILQIIYHLHIISKKINSKTIYDEYEKLPELLCRKVNYTRIVQIITELEKNNIVYVKSSKKLKLRDLSIDETVDEIKDVLLENKSMLLYNDI